MLGDIQGQGDSDMTKRMQKRYIYDSVASKF